MSSEQGDQLIALLQAQNTRLDALGMEVAKLAYWAEISAVLLLAVVFFGAVRRYIG